MKYDENQGIFVKKDLMSYFPIKSIVPLNRIDLIIRKFKIFTLALIDKNFRKILKFSINQAYRNYLASKFSIKKVSVAELVDWSRLSLKLTNITSNEGQTTHIELLCILALTIDNINNSNFLEIGTYDGNTAYTIASNLPNGSKVITIDLPEGTVQEARFGYDNYLIHNPSRAQKKHLLLSNVQQVYSDSTMLDFSGFDFNIAFIDGGHDFITVKSDTFNILNNIKSPGVIIWHDYDVECEIGDLLHHLAKDYLICHIEGTRLTYLKV